MILWRNIANYPKIIPEFSLFDYFRVGILNEASLQSSVDMSLVMRKPAFCICENKDAEQLRGYREADQRLCFRYIASTIPLLPKSKISSLYPSSVAVQLGLCRTWLETPKTGFLTSRLICNEGQYSLY